MKLSKEGLLRLHAKAGTIPYGRLNKFAEQMGKLKSHAVGYPCNLSFNLKDFYTWFVK